MIEVNDLVKNYGSGNVVDHLSFTVKSGQIYGFLGPNGAGKTTTMNILTGYTGMTGGSVTINGHDLIEEPDLVRKSIGYLPEQPPLYMDMTPKEYLFFAAELKKLPRDTRADAVNEVMELTKITAMQNRLIRNLSKGYRQRVGLAQAILGFPEIIILDEPTVGLDTNQIIEIRELIKSLAGKHTVILSSHILSEVQEICDHIMIIHRGKLVASGTIDELEQLVRGNTIDLTLKCSSEEQARSALKSVSGIKAISVSSVKGEEISMTVTPSSDDADIREGIFNACAEAKTPLLEMHYSGVSLERIFLDLTADKEISLLKEPEKSVDNENGGKE